MTQEPKDASTVSIEAFRRNFIGEERIVPIEATVLMSVRASSIADALVGDPRLLADVWGRVGERLNSRKVKEVADMMPDFAGDRSIRQLIALLDHLRIAHRQSGGDPDAPVAEREDDV